MIDRSVGLLPSIPAAAPATDLLARLKAETAHEHDAIEASLGLMDPALDEAGLRRVLERFFGFYLPLETGLARLPGAVGAAAGARRGAAWLADDLRVLGADPSALPLCRALPPHATPAQGLGCLYVLEGAALGGRIISRMLQQRWGLGPDRGARFFHGHGHRTGAAWADFRLLLLAESSASEADHLIDAARSTFRTLRLWCEEGGA